MTEISLVTVMRALDFAADRHSPQRRKGEASEPYLNHLAEVARLVAEATQGGDPTLVVAALLHDSIEDTETTGAELGREFGAEVAAIVDEVTDDKSLPKAERKQLQIERAARASPRAKMIKLADKTSNLRSIVRSPPVGWSLERQTEYFEWASAVAAGCRGVSPGLEEAFDQAHRAGLEELARRAH